MGCCGKVGRKVRNIAVGYTRLATGVHTNLAWEREMICEKECDKARFIRRRLWCLVCKCLIPAKALVEDEKCPLGKWERINEDGTVQDTIPDSSTGDGSVDAEPPAEPG